MNSNTIPNYKMLIKINKILPLKEDARGNAYAFEVRPSGYPIILNRKAGTTSGDHYHKGLIHSKSPDIFYLTKGKIKLTAKNIETAEEGVYEIKENTLIEIPPKIWHSILAITDIMLIEFNTTKEDFEGYEADTIKQK